MIPTFVYELPTGEEKGVILSLDLGKQNAINIHSPPHIVQLLETLPLN